MALIHFKWHCLVLLLLIFLRLSGFAKSQICYPGETQTFDGDESVEDEFSCSPKCASTNHCYGISYHDGTCTMVHSMDFGSSTFSNQEFRNQLRIKTTPRGVGTPSSSGGWTMDSFGSYLDKDDVEAQAAALGFTEKAVFYKGTNNEITKYYKRINTQLAAFQGERACMEQNGTLPIVHTAADLTSMMEQLNMQEEEIFVSFKLLSDQNGLDNIYWPDGFKVFSGANYNAGNHKCTTKYFPGFKDGIYGLAQNKGS